MDTSAFGRCQRIIQWVVGGNYAVAVEVEAVSPPDDPSDPCLTPLDGLARWRNLRSERRRGTWRRSVAPASSI